MIPCQNVKMYKCIISMLKCQNVQIHYKHYIYNMSYFPYFSALKTDQKQPVSILKPAITGSYMIVP